MREERAGAQGSGPMAGAGPGPGSGAGVGAGRAPIIAAEGLPARMRPWGGERVFPIHQREVQAGFDYKLSEEYPFPKGSPPAEIISEGDWAAWVSGINLRLKDTRGKSHLLLAGLALGVPFFMHARKARANRRAKLWATATAEFNRQLGRSGPSGFEMVYAKTMTPRLNVVLL